MNINTKIEFGFLPYKWEIEFCNGKIIPVAEYDRKIKHVEKRLNKDGYIYPPIEKQVQTDWNWNTIRTIPKTKRPAYLFFLPSSHELYISPTKPETNIREASAGFIVHFLAFLFKTRLQFAEKSFDGRIPMPTANQWVSSARMAGHNLSYGYKTWSKWREEDQKRFTNILYMYSRVPAYHWDCDQFMIQYMILDACWRMAANLFGFKAKYSDRIRVLCKELPIKLDNDFIDLDLMKKFRNDLFHEVLWYNGRPGSPVNTLPYHMTTRLRVLNDRIIRALIEKGSSVQNC